MTMTKQQRAARAKKWKRKSYDFEFPSGTEAEIQRPRMTALITKDGNIPNSLMSVLFDADKNKQQKLNQMNDDQKAEYLKNMVYLANQVAVAAFVSPSIVLEGAADYDKDQIHIDDIEDEDKDFIMSWAMGQGSAPEDALKRFLERGQTKSVDATPPR
jgi:hypothetical protein